MWTTFNVASHGLIVALHRNWSIVDVSYRHVIPFLTRGIRLAFLAVVIGMSAVASPHLHICRCKLRRYCRRALVGSSTRRDAGARPGTWSDALPSLSSSSAGTPGREAPTSVWPSTCPWGRLALGTPAAWVPAGGKAHEDDTDSSGPLVPSERATWEAPRPRPRQLTDSRMSGQHHGEMNEAPPSAPRRGLLVRERGVEAIGRSWVASAYGCPKLSTTSTSEASGCGALRRMHAQISTTFTEGLCGSPDRRSSIQPSSRDLHGCTSRVTAKSFAQREMTHCAGRRRVHHARLSTPAEERMFSTDPSEIRTKHAFK